MSGQRLEPDSGDADVPAAESRDGVDVSEDHLSETTEVPAFVSRPQTPQTPSRHREQQTQTVPQHHERSPSASPMLPLPMNLHQLGIAQLSPLRRQFSSPFSSQRSPSEAGTGDLHAEDDDDEGENGVDEENDDVTQDSKDVLVDRLNDLLLRLSTGDAGVREDNIGALHAQVDEMERVLAGRPGSSKRHSHETRTRPGLRPTSRPSSLHFVSGDAADEHDSFGITSPSWFLSHLYSHESTQSSSLSLDKQRPRGWSHGRLEDSPLIKEEVRPAPSAPEIPSDVVESIVHEAEKLYSEMSDVVKSLQDRREESDHLHSLFIEREEHAAHRIIQLEGRVAELKDEVQESESELQFLRLQLKAIEVQCLEYIPPDADPELVQSIQNWKSDWTSLHERWAVRRESSHETESLASTSSP